MLTIEKLTAFGTDTEKGLRICNNNEALYLRLVKTIPVSEHFIKLEKYIHAGDYASGYQSAQALSGNTSNLCLDPLNKPIVEIASHLKAGDEIDYHSLLKQIENIRAELVDICSDDSYLDLIHGARSL